MNETLAMYKFDLVSTNCRMDYRCVKCGQSHGPKKMRDSTKGKGERRNSDKASRDRKGNKSKKCTFHTDKNNPIHMVKSNLSYSNDDRMATITPVTTTPSAAGAMD